ncbi:hypothetical protein AMQ83_33130 [Paenibacillus riograndensis]|nr:hypothetical protein AMQ83_33130 [Paenibacillus riograndensis]
MLLFFALFFMKGNCKWYNVGELTPFIQQRYFINESGKYDLILKPRQLGFTTAILAYCLWMAVNINLFNIDDTKDYDRGDLLHHKIEIKDELERIVCLRIKNINCDLKIKLYAVYYRYQRSRTYGTTPRATAAFKGGRLRQNNNGQKVDHVPLPRVVYFLLWNESIRTTKVANEIISVSVSLTVI